MLGLLVWVTLDRQRLLEDVVFVLTDRESARGILGLLVWVGKLCPARGPVLAVDAQGMRIVAPPMHLAPPRQLALPNFFDRLMVEIAGGVVLFIVGVALRDVPGPMNVHRAQQPRTGDPLDSHPVQIGCCDLLAPPLAQP